MVKEIIKENRKPIIIIVISGLCLICGYYAIGNLGLLKGYFTTFVNLIMAFIIGYCFAFLAMPVRRLMEKSLSKMNNKKTLRIISSVVALSFVIVFFVIMFAVIGPQLWESLKTLTSYIPKYVDFLTTLYNDIITRFPELINVWEFNLANVDGIINWGKEFIISLIPSVIGFSSNIIITLFNFLVAFVIAFYIIYDKEHINLQIKKLLYSLIKKEKVDYLIHVSNVSSGMFNNFIIGKAIDSTIIGILAYVCMLIFGFPFPVLISFIIGITNMIPVFGPFIGAVPGVIIIFIINPMQAVWFALFVLALQQFDGNILGPRILGDTLGLSSLWIMFAIIVAGGLFGVPGMFFGVPIFATIYFLTKEFVNEQLKKKNIELK
ncbi:MAG: AI-2E family transporter [Erysipelotrichaceae bacterium]